MRKIKLSELPIYKSLKGLYTLGTDDNNRSVRVSLEFIEEMVTKARTAIQSAIDEAKKIKKGDPGEKGDTGWLALVNHGTADTTFTLTPNAMHVWGEVAQLNLTLGTPIPNVVNEYAFEFRSPATPTNLLLPNTLRWPNNYVTPIIGNKRYQAIIINNAINMWELNV